MGKSREAQESRESRKIMFSKVPGENGDPNTYEIREIHGNGTLSECRGHLRKHISPKWGWYLDREIQESCELAGSESEMQTQTEQMTFLQAKELVRAKLRGIPGKSG